MTASGQTRRFELSWHVGFTPDSGRIAARRRTDASGQKPDMRCNLPTCAASITVMSYRPSQSIRVPALNAAAPRRKSALP